MSSWFPFSISLVASSTYTNSWVSHECPLSEAVLFWAEDLILFKMGHDVAGDDVFHQFAGYAGKGDGTVVSCIVFFSLLKTGVMLVCFQSFGRVPERYEMR